jgi:hypothetical protein
MAREAEVVGLIPKGLSTNGISVLDVRTSLTAEDDALICGSDILALVSQNIAAGTASVATLDRKGAVTHNRHRSRLGFPYGAPRSRGIRFILPHTT